MSEAGRKQPQPECDCNGIDLKFDETYAAEKLETYRIEGADPSTRALIEAITAEGVRDLTLLDIGGGVGALQHELLERGLASAQEVEASAANIAACQSEAEARGHADRISHVYGDFASVADTLAPADVVTLDRSICCWSDPLGLIDGSAGMARRLYGLVYPRDTWWVRYGWRTWGNVRQLIKRTGLRLMTPRSADVEAVLARRGLYLHRHATVGVWQIALFVREAPAPGE